MIRALLLRVRRRASPPESSGADALGELLRVGAAHDLSGEMLLTIL
jgi:hypothetical protein